MIFNKEGKNDLLPRGQAENNDISNSMTFKNSSLTCPTHSLMESQQINVQYELKILLQTCMQMWKQEKLCSVKQSPELQMRMYKNLCQLLEYVARKSLGSQQEVNRIQRIEEIVKRGKNKVEDILSIFENQQETRSIYLQKDKAKLINTKLNSLLNQIYCQKLSLSSEKKGVFQTTINQNKKGKHNTGDHSNEVISCSKGGNNIDILEEIVNKEGFQLKFTVLSQFICMEDPLNPNFEDIFSDDSFNTISCMKNKRKKLYRKKNWEFFMSDCCLIEMQKRLENLGEAHRKKLLGNFRTNFSQELSLQRNKKDSPQQEKQNPKGEGMKNEEDNSLNIQMAEGFSIK